MAPPPYGSAAALKLDEPDPVWAAMLASPLAEEALTDEELAGLEEGMADIRAGRVVHHDVVATTLERMQRRQSE